MYFDNKLWMAGYNNKPKGDDGEVSNPVSLLPQMANRHGLITGATGTGKTTTVKVLAEAFSDAGIPVFLSDIKGDLSGMSQPGVNNENMQERIERFGLSEAGWEFKSYPTTYWDVFGKKGTPVRAKIYEMGSLLLSRIMDLTEAQEGVLNIVYKIAHDQNFKIYDIKDLKALVQAVGDHADKYKNAYGNITSSSIGAIQRSLLKLEEQGADKFFGLPALDIVKDWIDPEENVNDQGQGTIHILNCEELFQKPDLYAAFLVWMLSEIYDNLEEAGDLEKPKFVFFFDEAHILFNTKSKELLEKVEQVVRLIRSKAVGVYFITQSPTDIPTSVMSQLGNKIQHALRAYTPADQKIVKAAAQSFVVNPNFDTEETIPLLGTGEALVSFLDEKGKPQMTQREYILPPQSMMGTVDENIMAGMIQNSKMGQKYNELMQDKESAYYVLYGDAGEVPNLKDLVTNARKEEGKPVNMPDYETIANSIEENTSQTEQSHEMKADDDGQYIRVDGQLERVDDVSGSVSDETDRIEDPKQNQTQAFIEKQKKEKEKAEAELEALKEEKAETDAELAKLEKEKAKLEKEKEKLEKQKKKTSKKKKSELEKIATSAGRTAVNSLIRKILK